MSIPPFGGTWIRLLRNVLPRLHAADQVLHYNAGVMAKLHLLLCKGMVAVVRLWVIFAILEFISPRLLFSAAASTGAATTPWHALRIAVRDAGPHLIAAAVARGVSISAFYPVETIKTRMQMEGGAAGVMGGLKGMYAGLGGSLFGQIPYGMLTFGSYEMYKVIMLKKLSFVSPVLVYCAAAILGDLTGSLWLVPSEVVKVQIQGGMHASAFRATVSILKESGFAGLYRGYRGQVMRDVPFRAIQITGYEVLKTVVMRHRASRKYFPSSSSSSSSLAHPEEGPQRRTRKRASLEAVAMVTGDEPVPGDPPREVNNTPKISGVDAAVLGAIAGSFSAALTQPFDVVRTRLMTGGNGELASLGVRELFVGFGPRILLIAPSGAVFFLVYEGVKRQFVASKM